MIRSMTGFGKGEGGGFTVEMRAVNHKFLDLSIKLPKDLLVIENRLKKAVSEKFSRGRIDIYVTRGGAEAAPRPLRIDMAAARQYYNLLSELKDVLNLPGEPDLQLMASYRDIVTEAEVEEDAEEAWKALEGPLAVSMESLDGMRLREGSALSDDIRRRAKAVLATLGEVADRAPAVVEEYRMRLRERVERLSEGMALDADRLVQEVALYAERSDVTEEITRAKSHISQLEGMMDEGGPVGRKMDFLIQEINREVNTIASKSSDREIAYRAVEMKGEIEKIREQVQNIE